MSQSTGEGGGRSAESQDLEAFLLQGERSAPRSAIVGTVGRLLGFSGTMLGIGGLCFGAVVVRNHRRDLRSVLNAVRYSGLVVVAGTCIDLVAHLAKASNGWWEIFTAGQIQSATLSTFGLAVGLRIAAGSLAFATARIDHHKLERRVIPVPQRELVLAGGSKLAGPPELSWEPEVGGTPGGSPAGHGFGHTRPLDVRERPISIGSIVAVVVLLVSFTLDGHTVTEGNRWITGTVDMIHVAAASIWTGGVVAFSVVMWRRYRRGERLGGLDMALRFSVVAGAALAVAGLAGTILAVIILDSVSQLWATPWGRLLVAKSIAVAAASSLGAYNHVVVIPWMNANPEDDARSVRIRNTATGEAILLLMVIVVTAFLVGASSQA